MIMVILVLLYLVCPVQINYVLPSLLLAEAGTEVSSCKFFCLWSCSSQEGMITL